MVDLISLYSKKILSLAAEIPHAERLTDPDASSTKRSPLCGSTITVDVKMENGRISEFGQDVKAWILAQPIITWDLGHAMSMKENTLLLGLEWQYWHNKLGTDSTESVPQLHVEWTF